MVYPVVFHLRFLNFFGKVCLDITHTEWLETYLCSKLSPPKNTYIQFYTISECLPTVLLHFFILTSFFIPIAQQMAFSQLKIHALATLQFTPNKKTPAFFMWSFFSDHGCVLLTKYHKKWMVEGQQSSNKNVGPTFFILPPPKKVMGAW